MNSLGKYIRSKAVLIECSEDICTTYISENRIENSYNMGELALNIVGNSSTHKTLRIYSNTDSVQLFTATWLIDADIYNDAPVSETDWTAFKSSYVTNDADVNTIEVDLTQHAEDNGTIFGGEPHSYTITSYGNNESCQTDLRQTTELISVAETPQTYILVGAGESTMVGRAEDNDPVLDTTDPRIFQLGRIAPDNNTLILGDDPLQHYDDSQTATSVGVMMEYARTLLPNIGSEDRIIIVPVARGGSGFHDDTWIDGGYLYEDAITRANLVKALDPNNSTMIWVTALGVNDGFYDAHATYQTNFDTYDYNIRRDLTGDNYEMLHLVMGMIPSAYNSDADILTCHNINVDVGNRLDNAVYVQWEDGLPIGGGDLHPNGVSNRTLGARLYTNQAAFVPTPQTIPDVPSNLAVTGQDEQVLVTWNLVNNADSYVLEYKLDSEPTTWTEFLTASVSNTITSLTNGSLYNFRVKSRNDLGDSTYSSTVNGTPEAVLTREVGAEIHHVFGTDYATFEDIQGGGALTLSGASPSVAAGHIGTGLTTATVTTGLNSAIAHDTTSKTVIAVVKLVDNSNGCMILGNITTISGDGGFSIFESGDAISAFNRGAAGNQVFKATTDYTGYIFVAISMDGANHLGYYNDSLGGKSVLAFTGTINSSTKPIGIGNPTYKSASFGNGVEVAEFIIFDSAKTEAELDDIKTRSTARLAARGITV